MEIIPEPHLTYLKENKCPVCAKPKHKWNRRTDWTCCSVDCTKEYRDNIVIIKSWTETRRKAFERDNYTCVKCGKKTSSLYLIGDHIIPIALGGDEWDLDNVQTLCKDKCNKIKTRQDAKDIANQRRIEKKLVKGQIQLPEVIASPPTPKGMGIRSETIL